MAEKPLSPQQQREKARREEKLADVQRQVEEGSLVIRKMTPEERKANPPRERPPKPGKRS
jgi:hypothetical protein